MGLLNRETLLKKEMLEIRKVDLGKGDFVYVRQMTGRERDQFEQSLVNMKQKKVGRRTEIDVEQNLSDFRAKLSVCTVCDVEGNLLLTMDDYETLSTHMSAARLEAIVNVAQELNSISEEDKEELVKN